MRILIVEDDERIASFMKRGLEAESYEVAIASNKTQTLDLIEAYAYGVIILDIFLGPDDGLDICRTLRRQGVDSSILLMTAKGTSEIEKMSKSAGADAYLPKPFSFDDLVDTIARLHKAAAATDAPEDRGNLFTDSNKLRPMNMSVADSDMPECFSTNINPLRGQQ